ncbi:hypothetical protein HPB47_015503 [Ixodes persulcatus]|uniref:Uncharacterized protein n=1 Tax=Ixodes persulcatus TaxID=34615 RepID=A0AC60QTB9_IXOPE|nr:hypothetical protein HPB47_015503 [Ixodes persulcatus]
MTATLTTKGSCATRTEGKGKMDVLRAKLRQLRKHNKRLQQRLQRRRHMLTVTEIVESVRSLVSPAVAALVEAQLMISNASEFGGRWQFSGVHDEGITCLFCPNDGAAQSSQPLWDYAFAADKVQLSAAPQRQAATPTSCGEARRGCTVIADTLGQRLGSG